MDKKVIIINGAGIGKYKFLDKLRETEEFNVYSSVSKVKELAKKVGWDGKTLNEKERQLICDLKDAYTKYNNGPIEDIINGVEKSDKELNIVLSRETKDNDQLRKHFDNSLRIVLFSRVGDTQREHKNHADKGMYGYDYDKVFLMFDSLFEYNLNDFKELIKELKSNETKTQENF